MDGFYFESSMADSFIYEMFNTSGEVQSKIQKGLLVGKPVTEEYFGEQLMQMERLRFSPIYQKVIYAFRQGAVRILDTPEVKMTKSLPFIVHRNTKTIHTSGDGPAIIATIFLSSFGKVDHVAKTSDIPAKSLYVLLEAAYIGRELQVNARAMRRSTMLMRICNEVYTSMAMRLLNRDYALSLDTKMHDQVAYLISRFFLDNVWECENDDVAEKYAISATSAKDPGVLQDISDIYHKSEVKTVVQLFELLKDNFMRMSNASVRFYVERYINTYGGSSIMAIDYLPYIFFVISNILIGGFLVNQSTLNDLVKEIKDVKKYYSELSKTM